MFAAGNFSITAALAKHFALFAAQHVPSWEIVDYAHADKPDAPSGTTRELAEELATIAENRLGLPVEETHGARETRGVLIAGTPVHSVRLPSYTIAFETLFGLPDERLTIIGRPVDLIGARFQRKIHATAGIASRFGRRLTMWSRFSR